MLWNSPATILAIAAAVISLGGAIASWWTLARSIRSAKSAKESATEATNQATFANSARAEIAEQLKAANQIGAETKRVAEEQLAMAKQRRELALEIGNRVAGRDGEISLFVTVRNKSHERTVTIHRFFAYSKVFPGKQFDVYFGNPTGSRTIVPDTLGEFELRVFKVAEEVPLHLAGRQQWKLAVEFQGDANHRELASNHVEAFLLACWDLREWMEAHPEKKHPGQNHGWSLEGFQHAIRL